MTNDVARSVCGVLGSCCIALGLLQGCGDDDTEDENKPCTAATDEGCKSGQVCEEVVAAAPGCFSPVKLRGRVLDMRTRNGVEGATVVALDSNSSARSSVVSSGADGWYEMALPVARTSDGTPIEDAVTLRVSASGYQSFPTAPREALPVELSGATTDDPGKPRIVANTATDVALAPLPGPASQLTRIAGRVDHQLAAGALVVALQSDRSVSAAIADITGDFTLFNVPAGETRIEAYRAGLRVEPQTFVASAGVSKEGIILKAGEGRLARATGSLSIVNAQGGLKTSVILALESTFSQQGSVVRGLSPAGLRAADISGAFVIENVPPGRYAVLAAFENDQLVRDPDQGIGGTDVVHIEVLDDGSDVALGEGFKVTEALAILSPGADGLGLITDVEDPSFEWTDDSSEDGYELRVFDAFGQLIHEALDIDRVSGGGSVHYTWAGAQLEPGFINQFRVLSWRSGRGDAPRTYVSATEDLRGTFAMSTSTP